MDKKIILVQGKEITLLPHQIEEDYISLTDIMKGFDDEFAIYAWLRNKNTVEFLGVWEELNNPNFKGNEFVRFKNKAGSNSFNLTPKKWIDATDAIGIIVKSGRYGGGTFAHKDIAINFCYWLSPTFQLYLIKEFQKLKEDESIRLKEKTQWHIRRELSKINYYIQTDAIQKNIIPNFNLPLKNQGIIYASEADLLNKVVFDMTASEWRNQNADKSGNIRDHASDIQLTVLSNLESHNAELIKQGLQQEERIEILERIAQEQIEVLFEKQQREVFKKLKKGN
jgi:KilA-N domain